MPRRRSSKPTAAWPSSGGADVANTRQPRRASQRARERRVFRVANSVTVSVARAGEDVRVLCWLSSEINVQRAAPAAMMLQGIRARMTMIFTFLAKITDPGEVGAPVQAW